MTEDWQPTNAIVVKILISMQSGFYSLFFIYNPTFELIGQCRQCTLDPLCQLWTDTCEHFCSRMDGLVRTSLTKVDIVCVYV